MGSTLILHKYPRLLHWFWWWLVTWLAPRHYLNQCWIVLNWTPSNNIQWNFKENTTIFYQENVFKNALCNMAATLLWPPKCQIEINQFYKNPFSEKTIKENISFWIDLAFIQKSFPGEIRKAPVLDWLEVPAYHFMQSINDKPCQSHSTWGVGAP